MTNTLASPIIPAAVLVLLTMAARFFQRSWWAPSVFAPAIWTVYVVLPLILVPEYRVSCLAVWLIVLLVGCVMIGAFVAEAPQSTRVSHGGGVCVPVRRLLGLSLLLSAVSLCGAIYTAVLALSTYGLERSIVGLLAVGHLLSVERYAGEQTPFLVRILVTWTFPAALLAGIAFAGSSSRRERLLCFAPLVPSLFFSLVEATKANTLIAGALGVAAYAAMRVLSEGRKSKQRISFRSVVVASTSVVVGLTFFVAIETVRTHTEDQEIEVKSDVDRAKSTAFGYLAVFSDWVTRPDGLDSSQLAFGQYTLGGLAEVIGVKARQLGVYSENVTVGSEESNIYTAFRGLLEDFTIPGASLMCVVAGYLAGRCYGQRVTLIRGVLTLIAFYSFLIWSPIGSIFIYNGSILAVLVALVTLRKTGQTIAVFHGMSPFAP